MFQVISRTSVCNLLKIKMCLTKQNAVLIEKLINIFCKINVVLNVENTNLLIFKISKMWHLMDFVIVKTLGITKNNNLILITLKQI